MTKTTVVCGDCAVLLPELWDKSVDAIITDPPYNEVNRKSAGLRSLDKGTADSAPIRIRPLAREFARLARGWIYVWCGTEQVSVWRRTFVRLGWSTRLGVWHKSNPSPMNGQHLWLSALETCVIAKAPKAPFYRHCAHPIWRGPVQRVRGHPTPKPTWLMKELITSSVPVGGLVLDPFAGSGSTGVACVEAGRAFMGIELNKQFATLAERRIAAAKHELIKDADYGVEET